MAMSFKAYDPSSGRPPVSEPTIDSSILQVVAFFVESILHTTISNGTMMEVQFECFRQRQTMTDFPNLLLSAIVKISSLLLIIDRHDFRVLPS